MLGIAFIGIVSIYNTLNNRVPDYVTRFEMSKANFVDSFKDIARMNKARAGAARQINL